MNPAHLLCSFVVLITACQSSGAADQSDALAVLSRQLAAEKSKPEGSQSAAKCPAALIEFKGLSRLEIHKSLGSPDTFKLKTVSPPKISEATYFIAPKSLHGIRRGGQPEITFHFNDSEKVVGAECALSK